MQHKDTTTTVPSVSHQEVSIADLLPQLLDLPTISQELLSRYIREHQLDSQTFDKYFDVSEVNKQAILEYVLLYKTHRERTPSENSGYFAAGLNAVASFSKRTIETVKKVVTNEEELDSETLQRIVMEVLEKISSANSFKDYYNLIRYLRDKAEEAQGKRTSTTMNVLPSALAPTPKNSLLWCTLHATAGLTIYMLSKKCPGFQLKVAALDAMVVEKINDIYVSNTTKFGEDTAKLTKELHELYLELANLGDINAIYQAMQLGELTHLKLLQGAEHRGKTRVNKAIPTCLQNDFFLLLYRNVYQVNDTHKEFQTFWREAWMKGLAEEQRMQLEEKSKKLEEARDSTFSIKSQKTAPHLSLDDFIPDYSPPHSPTVNVESFEEEEKEAGNRHFAPTKTPLQTPGIGSFTSTSNSNSGSMHEEDLTIDYDNDSTPRLNQGAG